MSLPEWLARLQSLLIEPPAALQDAILRRKGRLLAIFLLVMVAVFTLVDLVRLLNTPGYQPPWYGYLLIGVAYTLNRTRYYDVAATVTIAMFPLVVFSDLILGTSTVTLNMLQYLVLGLILASIFLSLRGLLLLAIVNIGGLLLMPLLAPVVIPSFGTIVTPLAVNILGTALTLVFLRHRDQLEQSRQAELRSSEERLKQALEAARRDIAAREQAEAEQARAEAALRDSEERHRIISELTSDYAFSYRLNADGSQELEWVTDAVTRITGYTFEEIRYYGLWQSRTHPDDEAIAQQRRQRLHAGLDDISEYRVFARDGHTLWLRYYSRPVWDAEQGRVVRIYGAVQDMTTIRALEQQLLQAQKLEALGRVAGGIAHDFRNLLTVIFANTALLLEELPPGHNLRHEAEQIQSAAKRAEAMIRQLLAFSRQQRLQPSLLNLNAVVFGLEPLLRQMIRAGSELRLCVTDGPLPVKADPVQLEQVIMNLAINACDAMPEGGELTIETARISAEEARKQGCKTDQPHVVLKISDTGIGMDTAIQARIFEPFFTTKQPGKGTGLGLPTVHGIVLQSGGHIQVESAPAHGTTFTIYLPQTEEA